LEIIIFFTSLQPMSHKIFPLTPVPPFFLADPSLLLWSLVWPCLSLDPCPLLLIPQGREECGGRIEEGEKEGRGGGNGEGEKDEGWKTENGDWRPGDGGWRTEDGGRRTEDGGQRMEDGGWRRTEDGGRRREAVLTSEWAGSSQLNYLTPMFRVHDAQV
jgi:hypothetical protein